MPQAKFSADPLKIVATHKEQKQTNRQTHRQTFSVLQSLLHFNPHL